MVVAVRDKRILASLVTFALLAGSAVPTAGALVSTEEPDCQPADDGTDAYLCEVPEECRDSSECEPPSDCEWTDETTVRCEPPDDTTLNESQASTTTDTDEIGSYDLIRPDEQPSMSGPAADCRADTETGELVCRPTEGCLSSPECQPPEACQRVNESRYRCPVSPGQGPPGHAEDQRSEDRRQDDGEAERGCEPGHEEGTFVCPTPPECQDPNTTECPLPPECEPRGDGTALCAPPEDARRSAAAKPSCEPGPERGTIVCEPPAECEGQVGETARCTPPPECQPRGDGTFLCEIPDRGQPAPSQPDSRQAPDNGSTSAPETGESFGDEDLFGNDSRDAEARAQARAAIAENLSSAAETFRGEIQDMREDYEQRVDELRAEYRDGKDALREDYQHCRDEIPDDADPGERNDRLRDCLEQARQGLEELETNLTKRHDAIKSSFKDKAEQARTEACQKAERAALDAVARHGLFTANPGDLLPERALDLCPSFADFDRGGEDR